ncbi:MAG: hypothetical protein M1818_006837 [Claussenomyces sp. TS43310]|nr:MAG: hypothetical protein M1818_006837 [Claussenomyces sp. TS43310]
MCCRHRRRRTPLLVQAAASAYKSYQGHKATKQLAAAARAAPAQAAAPALSAQHSGTIQRASVLQDSPPAYEKSDERTAGFAQPASCYHPAAVEMPPNEVVLTGHRAEMMQKAEEKAYAKLQKRAQRLAQQEKEHGPS